MTDSGELVQTFNAVEGETKTYNNTLRDEAENPIPGSVLDSLTLTYFQEYTRAIINGRNAQNVNGANQVTVDSGGVLVWLMTAADLVILNDALRYEPHMARFDFTYPSGKVGKHEVRILVRNLRVNPT